MIKVEISHKTVNRFDILAESGEYIKYNSPFRNFSDGSISPGYGQIWNAKAGKKGNGDWEPAKLPWQGGEILKIEKMDLNEETNAIISKEMTGRTMSCAFDTRKAPTFVVYYYEVKHEDKLYRFSSVYGEYCDNSAAA